MKWLVALLMLAAPAGAQTITDAAGPGQSVPGPAGKDGANGSPGTAATAVIGAVSTGAPGTPASVVNVGTPTAAVWNIVIPKGDAGVSGGIGAQGPTGPAGIGQKGDPGTAGANGVSPALSLGTVTTLPPGSLATALLHGTVAAPIIDLALPSGQPGTAGITGSTGPAGAVGAAGPSSMISLGTVTIAQTATVAIALGPRAVTVALAGCAAGERIVVTPTAAVPVGYGILDASCYVANSLTVNVYGPALALGASYSFGVKVAALR